MLLRRVPAAVTERADALLEFVGLHALRHQRAGSLSLGQQKLLEPRFIDMVFEILIDLRDRERKTTIMVEQNARKGLQFADLGYVLVAGNLALAASGAELLEDPRVDRLFLGG